MRTACFVLVLSMTAACGANPAAPTPAPAPTPPTSQPAAAGSADSLPIAQYMGSDAATGLRVSELLKARGIESSAGGSLGYSVWVDGADRAKAREILLAAAASECLPITLVDDQGAIMSGTRPATCPPL